MSDHEKAFITAIKKELKGWLIKWIITMMATFVAGCFMFYVTANVFFAVQKNETENNKREIAEAKGSIIRVESKLDNHIASSIPVTRGGVKQ